MQFLADLVTFTEEIRNGKLHFLCSADGALEGELNSVHFFSIRVFMHRGWWLTAGEGKGPSFIPLYISYQLTNIQTFSCNFTYEMTIRYFWWHCLYLADCYSLRLTTLSNYIWFIDNVMLIFVCLLDELILDFYYCNLARETGGLEFASTITFVLQANRLTKKVEQRLHFNIYIKMQKKVELESAIKSALEFHLRFHKLVHLTMHKKAQNNSAKSDLKGTHLIGLEGCTWRLVLACEDVFSISVNGSLNDALKGAHERTFEGAPKNALNDLPKDAKENVLEVALGLCLWLQLMVHSSK